jgi:hypothetical protein
VPERVRQTLVERPCLECPAITSFNGIPDREILGRKNGQALWHGFVWVGHVGILTTRLAALVRGPAQINSQNPTQVNSQHHSLFDPSFNARFGLLCRYGALPSFLIQIMRWRG